MPKGHRGEGWGCRQDLTRRKQLFPRLEQTPDLNRGALRLAGEVAVAELSGDAVPSFAHERAFETLLVMAKG
jgi:hypothetical protein